MPNFSSPAVYGDPITTSRPAPAAEPDKPEPKTKGLWFVKEQEDGSWWVMGADPHPKSNDLVLVAAFEVEEDAKYVRDLHNDRVRGDTDG